MKFDFFKSRKPKKQINANPTNLIDLADNDFKRAQRACVLLLSMEQNLRNLLQLKSENFKHPSLDGDIASIKVLRALAYHEVTGKKLVDDEFFPDWWHRIYGGKDRIDHSSLVRRVTL